VNDEDSKGSCHHRCMYYSKMTTLHTRSRGTVSPSPVDNEIGHIDQVILESLHQSDPRGVGCTTCSSTICEGQYPKAPANCLHGCPVLHIIHNHYISDSLLLTIPPVKFRMTSRLLFRTVDGSAPPRLATDDASLLCSRRKASYTWSSCIGVRS
jgi:hypothetical protein